MAGVRLLDDPVSHDFYLERYERSRVDSPFNGMVVARPERRRDSRAARAEVGDAHRRRHRDARS
jgi:hypothetical protein